MAPESETTGCRSAALATITLVVAALVFLAIGLALINQEVCDAGCETLGLSLLYAGLPISGLFGVGFGELVLAWPLDITFWVVLGFVIARRSSRPVALALLLVGLALGYGLVLSQFVEIAI